MLLKKGIIGLINNDPDGEESKAFNTDNIEDILNKRTRKA